jgi:hypothetical protein
VDSLSAWMIPVPAVMDARFDDFVYTTAEDLEQHNGIIGLFESFSQDYIDRCIDLFEDTSMWLIEYGTTVDQERITYWSPFRWLLSHAMTGMVVSYSSIFGVSATRIMIQEAIDMMYGVDNFPDEAELPFHDWEEE